MKNASRQLATAIVLLALVVSSSRLASAQAGSSVAGSGGSGAGKVSLADALPISAITITLPANPDALTAWNFGDGSTGAGSGFSVSASLLNGKITPVVAESKILVIIKKNGTKACGSYTSSSAPLAGFTTSSKVWSGSNAASLLGKGCTLSPGNYELSVQFFGSKGGSPLPLSDETIKPFTIKGSDQQAYQPPQPISPADGTSFRTEDLQKPLSFRWTPVIPKPQDPVTYRLQVFEILPGQSPMQAFRGNKPVLDEDFSNMTQASITNLKTGPCKPPYLCDFIWSVQALNREGKLIVADGSPAKSAKFSVKQ